MSGKESSAARNFVQDMLLSHNLRAIFPKRNVALSLRTFSSRPDPSVLIGFRGRSQSRVIERSKLQAMSAKGEEYGL